MASCEITEDRSWGRKLCAQALYFAVQQGSSRQNPWPRTYWSGKHPHHLLAMNLTIQGSASIVNHTPTFISTHAIVSISIIICTILVVEDCHCYFWASQRKSYSIVSTLNVNISPLAHGKLVSLISTYCCSTYYQYHHHININININVNNNVNINIKMVIIAIIITIKQSIIIIIVFINPYCTSTMSFNILLLNIMVAINNLYYHCYHCHYFKDAILWILCCIVLTITMIMIITSMLPSNYYG